MRRSDALRVILNTGRLAVFLCVTRGVVGGALNHSWDTLRLLVDRGVRATVIAWPGVAADRRERIQSLGCPLIDAGAQPLSEIPGLSGSIIVGICDPNFLRHADELKQRGCRRVWLDLMTWLFPQEGCLYRRSGTLEAHVFESEFQQRVLERELLRYGYRAEQGH